MNEYEVELKSTTFRTFYVRADSMDDAINRAEQEAYDDDEISRAWCENMEVERAFENDEQIADSTI
tara:strand:+ start:302 stop:499 length:198 start_codon:yes stop_codon:yes gene_type:complete